MNEKHIFTGFFTTEWIRYEGYELRKDSAGSSYVVPLAEAGYQMYDPFDQGEEILTDLLQLGQVALAKGEEDQGVLNRLLAFVEQYGLLGLMSAGVYNRDIIGEEQVLLIGGNCLGLQGVMKGWDYWQLFVPFAEEGDIVIQVHKRGFNVRKAEDSPKFYGKRPLALDLVFSRFYAEQVGWILTFAKNMVKHYEAMAVYAEHSEHLTEAVSIMPEVFHPEKLGYTISVGEKAALAWEFDGLKTTIETIYAFLVTKENSPLSKCPYCGKIFVKGNLKEKYCSLSCRNCTNVQNSRKRKVQENEVEGN